MVLSGDSPGLTLGPLPRCGLTGGGRPDAACVVLSGLPAPLTLASPHRLAPMRLYTLSKRHFVLVFVVFFVCFGLTVFVGIRGEERSWPSRHSQWPHAARAAQPSPAQPHPLALTPQRPIAEGDSSQSLHLAWSPGSPDHVPAVGGACCAPGPAWAIRTCWLIRETGPK